ncbi:MAG: hypothetical protein SFU25_07660 [Candidatus Caenarcaniphilales bacterium]|nr:hypothetical protein [Candidatus Caenarcaniphilales bacterium]
MKFLNSKEKNLLNYFLSWFFLCLGFLLLIFAFIKLYKFSISEDFPWLLSTGEYILTNLKFPSEDPFTWSGEGRQIIIYQWLFSSLVAAIHKIGGIFWLVKIFFLLSVFIYLIFPLLYTNPLTLALSHKGRRNKTKVGTQHAEPAFNKVEYGLIIFLVTTASFFMASANLSIRPLVFTSLFLLIQSVLINLFFFSNKEFKNKTLVSNLSFFSLFVLWSNFHLGFFLGLVCFLLLLITSSVSLTGGAKTTVQQKLFIWLKSKKEIALVLLSSTLGSLVNPYGFKLYKHLWQASGSSFFKTFINELQPLDFSLVKFKIFALFFVLVLWLFVVNIPTLFPQLLLHKGRSEQKNLSTQRLYQLSVLLLFCIATLLCKRFIIWSSLFFVLYLPEPFSEQLKIYKPIQALIKSFEDYKVIYFSGLTLLVLAFILIPERYFPLGSCQSVVGVISEYKQNYQRKNDLIFNDPLIGSCFQLQKIKNKPYADTRFDFFGEEFVKKWQDKLNLNGVSKVPIDEYFASKGINTIIIAKTWPLYEHLSDSKDYNLEFEDEKAAIIRKK